MVKAVDEGRIYEAFGCGTAAIISPVKQFNYMDKVYHIPIEEEKGAGPLSQELVRMLQDIQYGVVSKPEWQIEI